MGRNGDITGLTQSREHYILRCTGKITGTEEECGRKRTHIKLNNRGDTYVCLNARCNLRTDLKAIVESGGEFAILP